MRLYRSHHIAEFEPSLARGFFDLERSDRGADEASMTLVRVGIYPESEEIVCDYTIGLDVTNYLVGVNAKAERAGMTVSFLIRELVLEPSKPELRTWVPAEGARG